MLTDVPVGLTPCVCCQSVNSVPFWPGVLKCRNCGHVWANGEVSEEEIRNLYAEDYFKGKEYEDYEAEEPALRYNFRARLRELAGIHPKGARLFEIGAAYGYFLDEASAHFSVSGIDISEAAISRAKARFGLDVRCGDYLSISTPQRFDVICLWDTIEHLTSPGEYLAKAVSDLNEGGTLALSTGDIGSLCARIRGPRWRLFHPPTHIHYFTVNSIRTLLARLGFVAIRIRYDPFWRLSGTTARKVLNESAGPAGRVAYSLLNRLGLLRFHFPLNTYDLMTVLAQKPRK